MPPGERSLRRRGIESFVSHLASPTSTRSARAALRDTYEVIEDQLPDITHQLPTLRRGLLSVVAGASPPSPAEVRDVNRAVGDWRLISVALLRLPQLLQDDAETAALWERARTFARERFAARRRDRGETPLSRPMTRSGFFQSACDQLLVSLGWAVEARQTRKRG
jgi:hypothetical protein